MFHEDFWVDNSDLLTYGFLGIRYEGEVSDSLY
jgi:hypothetical protein